jgi:hypothetical protein
MNGGSVTVGKNEKKFVSRKILNDIMDLSFMIVTQTVQVAVKKEK